MSKELVWFYSFIESKEVVKNMPAELFHKVYLMICDYAETGEVPNFKSNEEFLAFQYLKKGVDVAKQHFKNKSEAGKKGMESRWHTTPKPKAEKPENKRTEPQKEPQKEAKPKKFVKPTLEEVRDYCKERKNDLDPEYFYDFQEARNWYLSNGKKMVDWKATIRTWERNNYSSGRKKEEDLANDTSNYGGSDFLKYLKSPD